MDGEEGELPRLLTTDLKRHFRQLVLLYQDSLYSFLVRLTASGPEAEDLVQEALLGAYVSLTSYPPERVQALKLRPWLYKIALNVWRNRQRGVHPQMLPLDDVLSDALATPEEEHPDALYALMEQSQELQRHLVDLAAPYRVVVIGYFFEDLSYQEIADLLDVPLGTVKSRLHRAMRLLRQQLQLHSQERVAPRKPGKSIR